MKNTNFDTAMVVITSTFWKLRVDVCKYEALVQYTTDHPAWDIQHGVTDKVYKSHICRNILTQVKQIIKREVR